MIRHHVRPEVVAQYAPLVPLDAIRPHPLNSKMHDGDLIRELIEVHGLYGPLQVQRSTGHIVAGEGRYTELLGLGDTHTAVQYLDVDDQQALAMLAADNEGPRRAGYNPVDHLRLLGALQGQWVGTGHTQRELDRLQRDLDKPLRLGSQTASRMGDNAREAVLVLPADDHAELLRLFRRMRQVLGEDTTQGHLGLTAARVAVAVLDGGAGHRPTCTCQWCTIARQAGASERTTTP